MVKSSMDKIFSFKNLFALIVIMVLFLALKDDGFIEYQTLLSNLLMTQ